MAFQVAQKMRLIMLNYSVKNKIRIKYVLATKMN